MNDESNNPSTRTARCRAELLMKPVGAEIQRLREQAKRGDENAEHEFRSTFGSKLARIVTRAIYNSTGPSLVMRLIEELNCHSQPQGEGREMAQARVYSQVLRMLANRIVSANSSSTVHQMGEEAEVTTETLRNVASIASTMSSSDPGPRDPNVRDSGASYPSSKEVPK